MKIAEHNCPKARDIELMPGHMLGRQIECHEFNGKQDWIVGNGEFCSILTDHKCPYCGKELDDELP